MLKKFVLFVLNFLLISRLSVIVLTVIVLFLTTYWWTVSQRMKSQLEATEMWFLRRMLRIAWTDKVSNDAVL